MGVLPALPANPTEVAAWLPHRAPMLLVDAVTFADKHRLVASRIFLPTDVFFQGHFPPPDEPLLPGVIVLEALAQAAALHVALVKNLQYNEAFYRFSKVEEVSWPAPIRPGDKVILQIEKLREKLGFHMFKAAALVGDVVVCQAQFTAKVTPRV